MKKSLKSISVLLAFVTILFFAGCKSDMTEDELKKYIKENTYEYEVVSVSQYMKTVPAGLAGTKTQEPRYTFTYIDEEGQLQQEYNVYHSEQGRWKVCLGDENKYVETTDGEYRHSYLYLTKETLKNMGTLSE